MQFAALMIVIILVVIIGLIRLQNRQLKKIISEKESALKQSQETIQYLTEEIENLAYSISHDLNAPLRGVEGFSRILQRDYQEKIDEEGREMLELIRENVQQLKTLLDGVLRYSRIGRKALKITEVDLNQLTEEAAKDLTLLLKSTNCIHLSSLPSFQADPDLIRQLIGILLKNALTFSSSIPEPNIQITGKDNGSLIHLLVQDNGIGFEPGCEERMFGLFQKMHSQKEGGGPGIGLALAKRIVERHHGEIHVEGKINEGATFTVILPKVYRNGTVNQMTAEHS